MNPKQTEEETKTSFPTAAISMGLPAPFLETPRPKPAGSQQLPVCWANMPTASSLMFTVGWQKAMSFNFANSALVFLLMWTPVVLEAMAREQALCRKVLGSALFSNSITRKKPALFCHY